MPLRSFGKSFKLSVDQDIMPYQVYTRENIDKVYVPIMGALHYVKPEDEKQFLANIDKWDCRGDGHRFNEYKIIKYSSKYCELDCNVLRLGHET